VDCFGCLVDDSGHIFVNYEVNVVTGDLIFRDATGNIITTIQGFTDPTEDATVVQVNGDSSSVSTDAANTEKPSVVQCANKIASGISIAGVIESGFDTSKHPYATWALDSTLGNTFAGLASIPEDFHTDPIKTYGDIVGGGLSQGLPVVGEALVKVGVPVATSKGLFGVATDALLAGTPLGLGKLGFDALVYAGSAAYCYAHR
jgi:hypothetical protein